MVSEVLEPSIDLLCQEYVLVQAWKKTASYIRYHNWYSDTLELDRTAVNLPRFVKEVAERLRNPNQWTNDPLRIVPAPKSQQWRVTLGSNLWEPVKRMEAAKLRPLAYATLKDQVAATAVMLCLADRVETIQNDPRVPVIDAQARKAVVSYGNRLFCDKVAGQLRHRWGSGKLYRAYFEDYRRFLSRPEMAAEGLGAGKGRRVVIVHSDLRQFYDRVRPALLAKKIEELRRASDDAQFYSLTRRLLSWEWDRRDSYEVDAYRKQAELKDFTTVALPQGLVASGFFANIALLGFDEELREAQSREITPGVRVEDACRYVDDLRIVLEIDSDARLTEVKVAVSKWIQRLLDSRARGLKVSEDKTEVAAVRGDEHPIVSQSRKMEGIQSAVSGGFDAIGGEEILNAVQGLIRSQRRFSERRVEEERWAFSPVPDVRDDTVARFAAARFRSTFRSLRPLLSEHRGLRAADQKGTDGPRADRTQRELDNEAKTFALGLIENWIKDPSNVRLLRIGLDIWPAREVLESVFRLLRPFTRKGKRSRASRSVAWYCLAEIFRAGATETGVVEDGESLPTEINVAEYRDTLRKEAVRLASKPYSAVPWYVRQQVLLYLAVAVGGQTRIGRAESAPETQPYIRMIRFLKGRRDRLSDEEFATLAILSRRAFRSRETAVRLTLGGLGARRLDMIAKCDPSFALEVIKSRPALSAKLSARVLSDLCPRRMSKPRGWVALSEVVLKNGPTSSLRNEFTLLNFAAKFLAKLAAGEKCEAITPFEVLLRLSVWSGKTSGVEDVRIQRNKLPAVDSMYCAPEWVPASERWRFQLGFLLRFILSAQQDFTRVVRSRHWKENAPAYRAAGSHWYQRLYGLYSGHSAFGDDWLPISEWVERLLLDLLRWPGCHAARIFEPGRGDLRGAISAIKRRVRELSRKQGPSGSVLMLPLIAPRPSKSSSLRPLRACVVQTAIPAPKDIVRSDLSLSKPAIRKRHRNHLSAALAAVERVLALRETHLKRDGRLDWLILPELSVHPRDVKTHLVPFARKYRTIILAGLTYESLFRACPLINSGIWVIPDWSAARGLQIVIRRQGKEHLAPEEEKLNAKKRVLGGFRPCQWLVGYDWSGGSKPALWLTAAICYDATDLSLVADLRDRCDVFAIPSLNKDVRTFDQMALALHYHMFQMVIVANNGIYGGSNAYAPYQEAHIKQVFHLHGQPQASIAFLEIDDVAEFVARRILARKSRSSKRPAAQVASRWKFPPAGM
jgi:Reverse transcriptase (RNA-dependent DNA polymerase)